MNLGCGTTVSTSAGWLNYDNSPDIRLAQFRWLKRLIWKFNVLSDAQYRAHWDEVDVRIHDLRRSLPHRDETVDFVYTSHFLEHLRADQAKAVLREVFRVLKPGGVLRVVVPDLAIGVRAYISDYDRGDAAAADRLLNWLQLSRPGVRDPHLWMYDPLSLVALLDGLGFVDVHPCRGGEGRCPDLDQLDIRIKESVHVEGTRPAAR